MRKSGLVAAFLLFAGPFATFANTPTTSPQNNPPGGPQQRFQQATSMVRNGDLPGGLSSFRSLAAGGTQSASLYWNWAQAATARGTYGEALWALLRGREIEPGDSSLANEIERLRSLANLDPAELSPEPLAGLARANRRFHVAVFALVVLIASVVFHALARLMRSNRWPVATAWATLAAGLALAVIPMAGSLAKPCAVVVQRGAVLADAASPTASSLGTLREGEVVPILEASGDYLRIQDSSGARGWVVKSEVWRLDQPPAPTASN